MSRRNLVYVFIGLILGLIGSTQLPLHAQKPPRLPVLETVAFQDAPAATATATATEIESKPAPEAAVGETATTRSLQDALQRPYTFVFSRPTPLSEVARRLSADLGGPVVLDLAALERLEVNPDDTVELDLKGVRLKTGLKLLLDQQYLTYRIIPEDNLMILTDKEGSDDPLDKVWAELRHLHNDTHDIQDAVEEIREMTGASGDLDEEGGPRLRKPTIIEELPENAVPGRGVEAPKSDAQPEPKESGPSKPPKRPRTRL